ncbi:MAG TPA: hypothetical protein VJU34_08745 [Phenylobacterium sp.]|nr:hypothetical protein [Phenylobacterium sp.]
MGAEKTPHDDKIQSAGRNDNAAEPNAGAERYPSARRDDGVEAPATERRSFEGVENPQPRQGAGDGGPDPSVNQGHMGPGGDPAEGKR